MLKGLDPLLSPDLLHVLAQMGHGDQIALVDRNFPAASTARRLVRLDGCDLSAAVRAMLSVLPLDTFVEHPIAAMDMVDQPGVVPEVQQEVFSLARSGEDRDIDAGESLGEDIIETLHTAHVATDLVHCCYDADQSVAPEAWARTLNWFGSHLR